MKIWNPWRGCHRYSEGCKHCYIHKGDYKRGVDTNDIVMAENFDLPIQRKKKGEYKITSNQTVYVCFTSDFLIEEADSWRVECWRMIKKRSDLHFLFLTKRIERFLECIPDDWGNGYDNVTVGVSVENQENVDKKLGILNELPIKHKNIICQPLIEEVSITKYLDDVELVVVGGESDKEARPLNYDWVLKIREECKQKNISFEFRQCGSKFIKDGIIYNINPYYLMKTAKELDIDFHCNN